MKHTKTNWEVVAASVLTGAHTHMQFKKTPDELRAHKGCEKIGPVPSGHTVHCYVIGCPTHIGGKEGGGWYCKYCQHFFCDPHMEEHYYEHTLAELAGDDDETQQA